jgi:hypothetical protein
MQAEERETIVRVGYGPGATVSIWSTERAVWSKCKKACWTLVSESKTERGRVCGQDWEASAQDVRISCKKPGRAKIKSGFAVFPENIKGRK